MFVQKMSKLVEKKVLVKKDGATLIVKVPQFIDFENSFLIINCHRIINPLGLVLIVK
jgi:hypothetical protein